MGKIGLFTAFIILLYSCNNDESVRALQQKTASGPQTESLKVKGCTHSMASNFNQLASEDDQSCVFQGCTISKYMEFDQELKNTIENYYQRHGISKEVNLSTTCQKIDGCMKSFALNYNAEANVDVSGSCRFNNCITESYANYDETHKSEIEDYINKYGDGVLNQACGDKLGCRLDFAKNYDSTAAQDDGSCQIEGCLIADHEFTDLTHKAAIEDYINKYGNQVFTAKCGGKYGCMLDFAKNYDSKATLENGSCLIDNCIQSGFENSRPDLIDKIKDYKNQYGDATHQEVCSNRLGCTHALATNKDAMAMKDDGSCIFKLCDQSDFKDFNQKNYDDVMDYLYMYPNGKLISENQCITPKLITINQQIDIQTEKSISSKQSTLRIFLDDSSSMQNSIAKMKNALIGLAPTLTKTNTIIELYRLSNAIRAYVTTNPNRIYDNADGYAFERTWDYRLNTPLKKIIIDENSTQTWIESQLNQALNNFQINASYTQERVLCTLSQVLHEKYDEINSTNSIVSIITNEEDYAAKTIQARANNCKLKLKYVYHYRYIIQKPRVVFTKARFYINLYYNDANNERVNNYQLIPALPNTVLDRPLWDSLSTSYSSCGQDVIDYVSNYRNLNLPANVQCRYRRYTQNYAYTVDKDIDIYNVIKSNNNSCNLANFNANGSLFTSIYSYFNINSYDIVSCQFVDEKQVTQYVRAEVIENKTVESEYNVNSLIEAPYEILRQNGITGEKLNNFYALLYFYNQANQNTCTTDELTYVENGMSYIELLNNFTQNGIQAREGNICEASYEQNVLTSIGHAISDIVGFKYKLDDWSNMVIESSLKVSLVNSDGVVTLLSQGYSVVEENGEYFLTFEESLKDPLVQNKYIDISFDKAN